MMLVSENSEEEKRRMMDAIRDKRKSEKPLYDALIHSAAAAVIRKVNSTPWVIPSKSETDNESF